jgi:NAD(P)-dependent dehydrogenase (short-subunit alcohol dehydrogenase family)
MASESRRVIVITGASRGLGVRRCRITIDRNHANVGVKLEWVRQLSQDPKNFIIALVRNPEKADLLQPFLGSGVVAIESNVTNVDLFPVGPRSLYMCTAPSD